jgi:hypothetical protein
MRDDNAELGSVALARLHNPHLACEAGGQLLENAGQLGEQFNGLLRSGCHTAISVKWPAV